MPRSRDDVHLRMSSMAGALRSGAWRGSASATSGGRMSCSARSASPARSSASGPFPIDLAVQLGRAAGGQGAAAASGQGVC
jgi:hypothetical protein